MNYKKKFFILLNLFIILISCYIEYELYNIFCELDNSNLFLIIYLLGIISAVFFIISFMAIFGEYYIFILCSFQLLIIISSIFYGYYIEHDNPFKHDKNIIKTIEKNDHLLFIENVNCIYFDGEEIYINLVVNNKENAITKLVKLSIWQRIHNEFKIDIISSDPSIIELYNKNKKILLK